MQIYNHFYSICQFREKMLEQGEGLDFETL